MSYGTDERRESSAKKARRLITKQEECTKEGRESSLFFTTRGLVRADSTAHFELPSLANLVDGFEAGMVGILRALEGMTRGVVGREGGGDASGDDVGRAQELLLAIDGLREDFRTRPLRILPSALSRPGTVVLP